MEDVELEEIRCICCDKKFLSSGATLCSNCISNDDDYFSTIDD